MRKRIYLLAVVVAAVFIGNFVANNPNKHNRDLGSLELANIEALTDTEASTTWSCVGDGKPCEAECGLCHTKIKSKGTLTGSHSCRLQ
ncbi:MAG: NVEALA domain-containing protein [Muribaculaceae bacterium]|nr:NVEALA domain-containing protein [Muribaculaceae bacterium]